MNTNKSEELQAEKERILIAILRFIEQQLEERGVAVFQETLYSAEKKKMETDVSLYV